MVVGVVARQPAVHLVEPQLRQDGDAVEPLLSQRLDMVAQRLDLEARKAFVERLDLLQADDVRIGLLQPVQQVVDAARTPLMFQVTIFMRRWLAWRPACITPKNANLPRPC